MPPVRLLFCLFLDAPIWPGFGPSYSTSSSQSHARASRRAATYFAPIAPNPRQPPARVAPCHSAMVFEDIRRADEHPDTDFNDEAELRAGPIKLFPPSPPRECQLELRSYDSSSNFDLSARARFSSTRAPPCPHLILEATTLRWIRGIAAGVDPPPVAFSVSGAALYCRYNGHSKWQKKATLFQPFSHLTSS